MPYPLLAARLDGSVVQLGDDFDLFGVTKYQRLVTDREALDWTHGQLDVLLHESGRWYRGMLFVVRSTNAERVATQHFCPVAPLQETTPADACAFLYAQFGHVPSKAVHLLRGAVAPDRSEADAPPASGSNGVDFDDLVERLRKAGKPTPAKLVEYMADKRHATPEDIAFWVHGNADVSFDAIRKNVRRTNGFLEDIGSRLSFRVASDRVFREVSPE